MRRVLMLATVAFAVAVCVSVAGSPAPIQNGTPTPVAAPSAPARTLIDT